MQGIQFVACMANIFYTIRNLNNNNNLLGISFDSPEIIMTQSAFLINFYPHDKIQLVAKILSP